MNDSINKELIFKYFAGGATALEKEKIDQWGRAAAAREQLFIWLLEWENQNLQYEADIDNGIARHRERLRQPAAASEVTEEEEAAPAPVSGAAGWKFYRIAAAAVVVLGILSGGWLLRDYIRYERYATRFGQTLRLQLADGSKVVLNSNSTLRVPRFGFGEGTRDVYMAGEANFSVTHTRDSKRFIVHTDRKLDVEVLGTEFNVYSRARGARVVLNKGKVTLHYLDGQTRRQIVMRPGDLVTMDRKGRASIEQTDSPQNYSAWKAHRFIFENESLREICTLFEDNFGLQVRIPDSTLAAQTISGSFTALNAEELLEILTDDSGLSYTKSPDGKTITLDY